MQKITLDILSCTLAISAHPSHHVWKEPSSLQHCLGSVELIWTTWRKRNRRARGQTEDKLYWVYEENAIEHLLWKSRCAAGRLVFAFYGDILKYLKEKLHHLQLQKSSILPDLKVDTRVVETAYSSLRLHPKVEKTMMKYYENLELGVEYQPLSDVRLKLRVSTCCLRAPEIKRSPKTPLYKTYIIMCRLHLSRAPLTV